MTTFRKDIDTNELIKMHINGKTFKEIADIFKVSPFCAYSRIKKSGINTKRRNPPCYWLGKHRSEETKQKLRESALEQFKNGMPEETKIKIRSHPIWNKGKKWSKEQREKIELLNSTKFDFKFIREKYLEGKTCSEIGEELSIDSETIRYHLHRMNIKLRNAYRRIGYVTPQNVRDNISNSNKGRKMGEGLKEKLIKLRLGKTYEEIYGEEKAKEIKKNMSISGKNKFIINPDLREHYKIINSGSGNNFYGRKHSIDTIKIIKETRKNTIIPVKDSSIELKIQSFCRLLHLEYLTHCYMNILHGYQCDIFIPVQNGILQKTVIECDGDLFHYHPSKYNKDSKIFKNSLIAQERWDLDKARTKELIEQGFRVIRLWERDIKRMELNEFKEKIFKI